MTWRERIICARTTGRFTLEDVKMAQSWHTCAVAEQHDMMPHVVVRHSETEHAPVDPVLAQLGCFETILGMERTYGFAHAVTMHDVDRAEVLLEQIEDRVLQLKREGMIYV